MVFTPTHPIRFFKFSFLNVNRFPFPHQNSGKSTHFSDDNRKVSKYIWVISFLSIWATHPHFFITHLIEMSSRSYFSILHDYRPVDNQKSFVLNIVLVKKIFLCVPSEMFFLYFICSTSLNYNLDGSLQGNLLWNISISYCSQRKIGKIELVFVEEKVFEFFIFHCAGGKRVGFSRSWTFFCRKKLKKY